MNMINNNNFKYNSLINKMNNSNLIEMMAQAKNFEAHRKKIAEIMNASSIRATVGTFDNKRIKVINTFYSNRDRSSRYSQKSKQQAVQKENDLILRKIIQVNNRRSNTLNARNQAISHNSMANLKKSMQNINLQNQKIAQKLVTTSSDLRQQKQYQSYKKHLQRKQRIKKYEFDEDMGMIIPKKIKSLQKLKAIQPLRSSVYRSILDLQHQNQQR